MNLWNRLKARRAGSTEPPLASSQLHSSHRFVRRAGVAVAAAAGLVSTALFVQGSVPTNASWLDSEWASGTVGTVNCEETPAGAFATRGEGHLLSGSALGLDTDTLAAVSGVTATNNGSEVTSSRGTRVPSDVMPDAYSDPLDPAVLGQPVLGLSGLLQLNLDTDAGVLSQFGQATSTGVSAGASGYLTDHGGINLHDDGGGYPELGTVSLTGLLNSVGLSLGGIVDGVADVNLEVGAVAGRAQIDSCIDAWSADVAESLTREYLAASLTTNIESRTVEALVTELNDIVATLDTAVNDVVAGGVVQPLIRGAINGLVDPLLGTLNLGSTTINNFAVVIDLRPVERLTSATITDPAGIVAINLAAGTVSVDTAALLAAAYGGTDGVSLNALASNTSLLADERILGTLTTALTNALSAWVSEVTNALTAAIEGVAVRFEATVVLRLLFANVGRINVSVDASLAELRAGQGVGTAVTLLGTIDLSVLDRIASALTSGLGPIVAGIVDDALPAVPSLIAELPGLTGPVVTAVASVYDALFLEGLVEVLVNAQNDPSSGGPEPSDWASTIPDGQYDVAAIRIGVLNAAQSAGVWLYLGRASVGVNCSMPSVAAGGCAGY